MMIDKIINNQTIDLRVFLDDNLLFLEIIIVYIKIYIKIWYSKTGNISVELCHGKTLKKYIFDISDNDLGLLSKEIL